MPQPPVIDCHCHIDPRTLDRRAFQLRQVLARCRDQGVEAAVVSVACDTGRPEHDADQLQALFSEHGLRPAFTLGFSPPTRDEEPAALEARFQAAQAVMQRLASHPAVVAIGEVGLDYYWPVVNLMERGIIPSPGRDAPVVAPDEVWHLAEFQLFRDAQLRIFARMAALASQVELPLVVHERRAHEDARQLLADSGLPPGRVMFHCFGAGAQQAASAARDGFRVSLPASIIIRSRYRELAAVTPLDSLLTETDSPYHSPIVGLWKRCRARALQLADAQGLKKRQREKAVNRERARFFEQELQALLPGLAFQVWRDGRIWTLPGGEHFRQSRARFLNEPAFVRFAAAEIASIKELPLEEVCAALLDNARGFYGLA